MLVLDLCAGQMLGILLQVDTGWWSAEAGTNSKMTKSLPWGRLEGDTKPRWSARLHNSRDTLTVNIAFVAFFY